MKMNISRIISIWAFCMVVAFSGGRLEALAPLSEIREEPTKLHLERFDSLKRTPVIAVAYDVDGNITDEKGNVRPKTIETIVHQLLVGIPILLISSRTYEGTEELRLKGAHDLKGVLDAIRDYLKQLRLNIIDQEQILSKLYIASEGGFEIVNGFPQGSSNCKTYHQSILKEMGIEPNHQRIEVLKDFLIKSTSGLPFEFIEPKKYSLAFVNFSEGRKRDLPIIKAAVNNLLRNAGLWDEDIEIRISEVSVEVVFYRIDKGIALKFFESILGLRDGPEGIILTIGDSGGREENDWAMLNRRGGLSSRRYDPDSDMIALSLISGKSPGVDSTLWAVRQFKYRTPQGIIAPKEEAKRPLSASL